jgi:hypothetical protein
MLALIIVVCITAITTLRSNANNTFSYVPHGEFSKDELAEVLAIALEGRRRVKEQLKNWPAGCCGATSTS